MTDAARDERGERETLLFAIALFAIAFALRFLVARALAGEPVWDGHYYDFGARRIAAGHGYSDDRIIGGQVEWHPWCHYPVGYSGYLAAFYVVLGAHAWVAHLANALAGAGVAVAVFLLAREGLSPGRARAAGILTALHPGLVLYGALVMGEIVATLGVVLAFWAALAGTRAWRSRFHGLAGLAVGALVLGISALVRPQALLCAPFLVLAAKPDLPLRAAPSAWVSRIVIACALTLVPVLPWTARNCAVMDGCALVSTNAGWNLAIGAFPRATGRFETLRSSDGCREVTGQVQQDRCWFSYGLFHIRTTPGRWLGLIPAKLANTFDHESFAVEYLREARPDEWPEERRVAWRTALTTIHRLFLLAAPLAFVAFPRGGGRASRAQAAALFAVVAAGILAITADRPTIWPIVVLTCILAVLPLPGRPRAGPALLLPVALLATTAATHAIFFGDDRYHMVVTPLLCLFAAAALRDATDTRGADTRGARAAGTSPS